MPDTEKRAGRELDVRVAAEVMGWTPRYVPEGSLLNAPESWGELDYWQTSSARVPCGWSPSTDIAAAWEVVEKMRADGWVMSLDHDCYGDGRSAGTDVKFWKHRVAEHEAHAVTAPLAICLAALEAMNDD